MSRKEAHGMNANELRDLHKSIRKADLLEMIVLLLEVKSLEEAIKAIRQKLNCLKG